MAKLKLEQQLSEMQERLKRQAIEDEAIRQERVKAAQDLLKEQYKAELDSVAKEMEKRVQEEREVQAAREKHLTERAASEKQQLLSEMRRLEEEKKMAEEVRRFVSLFSCVVSVVMFGF